MFDRTVICIDNDQPEDNSRPPKRYYHTTYSDDNDYDADSTQTERDTESDTKQQNETRNKPENQSQNHNQSKENNSERNKHNNVAHRIQKQNAHNQEYTMENLPPETNNGNYPPISNPTTEQKQTSVKEQEPTKKTPIEEPKIIPETQILFEIQMNSNPFNPSINDTQNPEPLPTATKPTDPDTKIISPATISSPGTTTTPESQTPPRTQQQDDILSSATAVSNR